MQSGTQAVSSRYLRNFPPHCWQILGVIVRCCHRAHLTRAVCAGGVSQGRRAAVSYFASTMESPRTPVLALICTMYTPLGTLSAVNSTECSPGDSSSSTSVATSQPSTSKTFSVTCCRSDSEKRMVVEELKGLG